MGYNKETLQFIKIHQLDKPSELALKAKKHPEIDVDFAITQIVGKQIAREKIPSWYQIEDIRYPRHLSLEQCSSELTALYKASLINKGEKLIDLTGGFGVDCAFLAPKFKKVAYVEKQKELCELASHNFPATGQYHIEIIHQEAEEFLSQLNEVVDYIFIDPARRNEHGGKTVAISDCEPDISKLTPLLLKKADIILVKLSPMLDLSLAIKDVPQTKEVHIISVENECKELLLILGKDNISEPQIHCINLHKNGNTDRFTFNRSHEQMIQSNYTSEINRYLYEPNSSLLKAGAYKSIASTYKLDKLHPNSHLYTSNQLIREFPGRVFTCESSFSLNKKSLKAEMGNIAKANITVRNFPISVAELRKRTKLKEGGEVYLFATTMADEKKVLLRCRKI